MFDRRKDQQFRNAAFDWLSKQVEYHGEVLPRNLLVHGFRFQGERVPFMGPQGIFKPAVMDLPLSITTVFAGPYDDYFSPNDVLIYKYRGTDPNHRDNVGLRKVMENRLPLVYFHAVVKGKYLACWPSYIVGDSPSDLTFQVVVDYASMGIPARNGEGLVTDSVASARRSYITATFKKRLHQQSFRMRVLQAYREHCALCRLKHPELLEAAHIIPDSEPGGVPAVHNGIALCKLHHAAFDRYILGITPDYLVEVRGDILEEIDGPMLKFGLQGAHGQKLWTPRRRELRPDRDALAWRFEKFKKAG